MNQILGGTEENRRPEAAGGVPEKPAADMAAAWKNYSILK
jgi:hypothetical protein